MSLRSLIKALDGFFGGSVDSKQLSEVVDGFHAKHNTWALIETLKFPVNDELKRCYHEYVDGNQQMELDFIDVLGKVCRVFTVEETRSWIDLYIKPAFEPGCDLRFVKRSREFLAKLVTLLPTNDAKLRDIRTEVSQMVIGCILKVYHVDTRGVVKEQCITWIKGVVGLQPGNHNLARAISADYSADPKFRYGLVGLVGQLEPLVISVVPLWSTLLTSLENDLSDTVVIGVLQLVVKVIPHLTSWQDTERLLAIAVRLLNWHNIKAAPGNDDTVRTNLGNSWNMLGADVEGEGESAPYVSLTNAEVLSYYITLLYGLAPREFLRLAGGDTTHIERQRAFLSIAHPDLTRLRVYVQDFYVHPLLVDGPLTVPFEWTQGDITLACLALNPELKGITSIRSFGSSGGWSQAVSRKLLVGGLTMKDLRLRKTDEALGDSQFEDLPKFESHPDESQMLNDHKRIYSVGNFVPETVPLTPLKDREEDNKRGRGERGPDYQLQELLVVKNQLAFVYYLKQQVEKRCEALEQRSRDVTEADSRARETRPVVPTLPKRATGETGNHENIDRHCSQSPFTRDFSVLINKLEIVENENESYREQLEALRYDYNAAEETTLRLLNIDLPKKTAELEKLRDQLENLLATTRETSTPQPLLDDPESVDVGTDWTEEVFNLKGELVMVQHDNDQLRREVRVLEDRLTQAALATEAKIEGAKFDVRETLDAYVKPYESKIDTLGAVIRKYEGLLVEKNARIAQLSSSKPILIPQRLSSLSDGSEYAVKGLSFAEFPRTKSPPLPFLGPSHQAAPKVPVEPLEVLQPILRGRGGYQKRKKG